MAATGSSAAQMEALRAIRSVYCAELRQHGTRAMYRTEGCRCDACREAEAIAQRHYRAARSGPVDGRTVAPDDTDWMQEGKCRGVDPAVFFPDTNSGPKNAVLYNQARRICGACPVRAQCLAHALEYEKDGMWGGKTPAERARISDGKHVAGCRCSRCRPAVERVVDPERAANGLPQEWCRRNQTSYRWGCKCRDCRASVNWSSKKSKAKDPAQHGPSCPCRPCTDARGGGRYVGVTA